MSWSFKAELDEMLCIAALNMIRHSMQFILFEECSLTHSVVWTVTLSLQGSSLLLRLYSSVIKGPVNCFFFLRLRGRGEKHSGFFPSKY